MGLICVTAESVEEVRAAAKMLRANHRALTADYTTHFATLSAAHAGNPKCGKKEEGDAAAKSKGKKKGKKKGGGGGGGGGAAAAAGGGGGGGGEGGGGKKEEAAEAAEGEEGQKELEACATAVNAASPMGFLPSFIAPPTKVREKYDPEHDKLEALPAPAAEKAAEQPAVKAPIPSPKASSTGKKDRRGKREKR